MKIAIGSDHRGVQQRVICASVLAKLGHEVIDCGTHTNESCDYPDIAKNVCEAIVNGEAEQGVLICGTGVGMGIAANKFPAIRAAVCHNIETAELCRQHNNANVLCLSGTLDERQFHDMIAAWLNSEFEGGRHQRRIDKIHEFECVKD